MCAKEQGEPYDASHFEDSTRTAVDKIVDRQVEWTFPHQQYQSFMREYILGVARKEFSDG